MATGSRHGSRKRATLGVGSRGPGMSHMCSQVLAEVHRAILALLRQITSSAQVSSLLDVGCWDGGTTIEYARAAGGARAYGIEVFQDPASQAAGRGISVAVMDLERDRFPWADQSIDLVVCNQVFEHLKNVWLPISEIARVLRAGARPFAALLPGAAHTSILWVQKMAHASEWPWAAYAQVLQATTWTSGTAALSERKPTASGFLRATWQGGGSIVQ